ncbi:MAG: GHMP kinase [Spirochaetales bacterium]|jgi:glucuronokinase|nr:GHMP kinase [Spirochaetales bacterium]
MITTVSYPRAALIGNPSDGFNGRTIAFTFSNFCAEVAIYESPEIEILPNDRDHSRFISLDGLAYDVERYGYYGGIRLIKATLKKFHDYCCRNGIVLDNRNFTLKYTSTIPHGLGLGGSSAIITACIRALMMFFSIDIPKPILANIVLAVETDELGISAGLQDRVAQVYQGLVYMDFAEVIMEKQSYGDYEYLDFDLLPDLYIAFKADLAEGSEKVHGVYRSKYKNKDENFWTAIPKWIELTERVKISLRTHKTDDIGVLLNENFDIRKTVQSVSDGNIEMIETARKTGASAKFTGSGGAIIGTYPNELVFDRLVRSLSATRVEVIKPEIAGPVE